MPHFKSVNDYKNSSHHLHLEAVNIFSTSLPFPSRAVLDLLFCHISEKPQIVTSPVCCTGNLKISELTGKLWVGSVTNPTCIWTITASDSRTKGPKPVQTVSFQMEAVQLKQYWCKKSQLTNMKQSITAHISHNRRWCTFLFFKPAYFFP